VQPIDRYAYAHAPPLPFSVIERSCHEPTTRYYYHTKRKHRRPCLGLLVVDDDDDATTRTCTAPSSIMRCCWRVALSGGFQLHALACTHRRRPRLCTSGGTVCADVRRAAAAAFSTRPGRGRTYGTGNQKQRKRQGAACIACTRLRLITFIKYDFFGLKYCHLARLWRLGRTIYILQIEVPVYLKRRLRMVHAYMMSSSTCSSVITLMMGTSSDRAQLVKKEWFMHVSSFFLPSLFNALESTTSFLRACLLI
jgi:hypothetical protein